MRVVVQSATSTTGFPHVEVTGAGWLNAALALLRPQLEEKAPDLNRPNAMEQRVLVADDGEAVLRTSLNDHWGVVSAAAKAALAGAWRNSGGLPALVSATQGGLPSSRALAGDNKAEVIAAWLKGVTKYVTDVRATADRCSNTTPGTLAYVTVARWPPHHACSRNPP